MSLTARQIIAKTPRSRRDAAQYAKIKEVKIATRPGSVYMRAVILTTHTNVGRAKRPPAPYRYVSTINLNERGQVTVSCSCEDFMYTWEYALAKKGAAKIEYGNGDPPDERNPLMICGACKHLYAFMSLLIQKGKL